MSQSKKRPSPDEPETAEAQEERLEIEWQTRAIAEKIQKDMPPGRTFMLFTMETGENPRLGYVSTCTRESAIELMREFLHRWGANQ